MDIGLGQFVWIVIAIVFAFAIHQIVTKGFKGAMFGARIERSFGEVPMQRRFSVGGKIKVHRLEGDKVGIELVQTSPLSWELTPLTISRSDALQLVTLLSAAAAE